VDSDEEDYDDAMLVSAMAKSTNHEPNLLIKQQAEPIALDDSDDDDDDDDDEDEDDDDDGDDDDDEENVPKPQLKRRKRSSENSSEFSVDNHVIGDDSDNGSLRDESLSLHRQKEIYEHRRNIQKQLFTTKMIVKKSMRILRKKRQSKSSLKEVISAPSTSRVNIKQQILVPEKLDSTVVVVRADVRADVRENTKQQQKQSECQSISDEIQVKSNISNDDLMEVCEEVVSSNETKTNLKDNTEAVKPKEDSPVLQLEEQPAASIRDDTQEESVLLAEITNSSVDDVFNRYISYSNQQPNQQQRPQSLSPEEFSDELFYCLQQSKIEIQKAQELWNEKLHVKYKIRELMEKIRRHKAVIEIETFGYKSAHEAANSSHPIMMSSKSSTTTNSEIDNNYDKQLKITNESVSRLIHDVRASILKRDEKQRLEETGGVSANASTAESFADTNNSAFNATLGSLQQGRQGPIIDVQSIINDFRQKNPQEIPRRGRRLKNSFGGGSFFNDIAQQQQEDQQQNIKDNSKNGNYLDLMKSNRTDGYPEVSLLPVHNFYKNMANSTGGSSSSLLQSILTKVTINANIK